MPTSWPKSLETIYGAADVFAKSVAEATDNKFQIQTFAAGEIVPRPRCCLMPCRPAPSKSVTPPRTIILARTRRSLSEPPLLRSNARVNQGWFTLGGGKEALNEFYKKYNCTALLAGNTGCQMGGWFRKEIQDRRGLQWIEIPHRGFPGRVLTKFGAVPQQIRGPRHLIPLLRRVPSTAAEWVGPYDDEKPRLVTRSRRTIITPGWWEGGSMLFAFVNLDKWNALPRLISTSSSMPRTTPTLGCWRNTSTQSPRPQEACWRRRQDSCVLT